MKILSTVGARPNFMKVAPLHRAFEAVGATSRIVHTGQHYDHDMSQVFFDELGLPEPHRYLGVGSGTHADQTARVMAAFEPVLEEEEPDVVVVVGDVNSTLACALVAAKRHVPVAHVEAGLRSGDRRMPEEINRLLTDRLADYLFVTEPSGLHHLQREGVEQERIFHVGNVMIDTLAELRTKARHSGVLGKLDLDGNARFVLMTMHRPANVDSPEQLDELVRMVGRLSTQASVVFPMHPRTQAALKRLGMEARLRATDNLIATGPLGYLAFLHLMETASIVVTDSGGIQEETTFLGTPCLTVRETTERPITVKEGTNELVPFDAEYVATRVREILAGKSGPRRVPDLWDGRAAGRIANVLGTQKMRSDTDTK